MCSLRHWNASEPPRGVPQQLDMKSERQLALIAESCASVGFAAAGLATASAASIERQKADAKILMPIPRRRTRQFLLLSTILRSAIQGIMSRRRLPTTSMS